MSETVNQEQGMESLNVEQAANKIMGLMDQEEASQDQPQPETQEQEVVEAAETTEVSEEQVEEQTEEEEAPQVETYRIKAEGEEHEVTLDDLVKNYQLEANVRKKMETLAHDKKELDSLKGELSSKKAEQDEAYQKHTQERQKYSEYINLLDQYLQGQNQQEDLSALKQSNPEAYLMKVAEQQERDKQLTIIRQEQHRLATEQQAQNQKLLAERLESEKKKVAEKLPDYFHPEKGKELKSSLRNVALTVGYTDQELNATIDSRFAFLCDLAHEGWKVRQAKPKVMTKVKSAPKMIRSGVTAPADGQSQRIRKLKSQAKKTGNIKDVANVFEAML